MYLSICITIFIQITSFLLLPQIPHTLLHRLSSSFIQCCILFLHIIRNREMISTFLQKIHLLVMKTKTEDFQRTFIASKAVFSTIICRLDHTPHRVTRNEFLFKMTYFLLAEILHQFHLLLHLLLLHLLLPLVIGYYVKWKKSVVQDCRQTRKTMMMRKSLRFSPD